VRPAQISAALAAQGEPVKEEAVAEALDRLAQPSWGNVLAFPDSSRVTALEDFYCRRVLYQLSREGEAAERALAQYDAALGTRGVLQSVALEDIAALLVTLRDAARQDAAVDDALIHQTLSWARSSARSTCRTPMSRPSWPTRNSSSTTWSASSRTCSPGGGTSRNCSGRSPRPARGGGCGAR